jgi:Phosphatidate phosphatase APP1, catalytic domain
VAEDETADETADEAGSSEELSPVTRGGERAPERGGYAYPMYRRNDRQLSEGYREFLFLWDIDNTYLQTKLGSLRDLLRVRFEAAEDKLPVPGAVQLLSALRRLRDGIPRAPVYFVSASPESMRRVLEKRMLLDGVAHDGISFRDLTRLRYLRDIFGYKLAALLLYRLENPEAAREVLFGDDREHDPLVYASYARVCAGTLRGDALVEQLLARGVRKSATRYIAALADELPERDPVEWIFIRRLEPDAAGEEGRASSLAKLDELVDERLVFVDDYAQVAALLCALDAIDLGGLAAVVGAVREAGLGRAPRALIEDPDVRTRLDPARVAEVAEALDVED